MIRTLLYFIADILQMELYQNNNTITGAVNVKVKDSPLKFSMAVVASFYHPSTACTGVVCKVKGKLYLMVSLSEAVLRVDFINADKLGYIPVAGMPKFKDTFSLTQATYLLQSGFVKSYYKSKSDTVWTELK